MVVRYVRPQQLTNLLFSCLMCKLNVRRPGIENSYCSDSCKREFLKLGAKRRLKRLNKKERKKFSKKKLLAPQRTTTKKSFNNQFYDSRPWLELRYKVLKKYGRKCMCCGVVASEVHVDHIKPISKNPGLALEFDNLQVLCKQCNLGKSNKDITDFRVIL